MKFAVLLLIALGLSLDTFAISISIGLSTANIRFRQVNKISLVFAFFQTLMPAVGWLAGTRIKDLISSFDHWLVFILLSFIGLKMIFESRKKEEDRKIPDCFSPIVLCGIAIATSIDALIAGISFALINMNILTIILLIGFTTYIAAMLGMLFGKKAGRRFGSKIEIAGGLILILVGVKILLEHLLSL